jgi:hypothetical protein
MPGINFHILTAPTIEPISLDDMKAYLNIDYVDPATDALIARLISQARRYAEKLTSRALAPQTIQATYEPDPIPEGELSGPIGGDFDPYRLNERITTVPFGFYGPMFDLVMPPVSVMTTVEYQLTPFDGQPAPTMQWTGLPAFDTDGNANYLLDTNTAPTSIALRPLLVANRYRFTYSAGYGDSVNGTPPCPDSLIEQMMSYVSFRFDNRQGQPIPDSIINELARERVFRL